MAASLLAQRSDRPLEVLESQFRYALLSRPPPPHLTEWDETMAVETRGGVEASMETLCNVLGVGIQLDDFARRTFVR